MQTFEEGSANIGIVNIRGKLRAEYVANRSPNARQPTRLASTPPRSAQKRIETALTDVQSP